jgi:hypothetical protein
MTNFNFILERLSSRAKNALIAAQMISEELKCDHIGTEHLLYGVSAAPRPPYSPRSGISK